jgi:putative MATE family efflux protein
MAVSYRGFFYGIGHTNMFMFSALITYAFNILFNYLLIFGNAGFPRMGVAGAGLAASIGMAAGFLFFVLVTFLRDYRKRYKYYQVFAIGMRYLQPIVRISLPVSFQNILILFGFLVFVAITGIIGTLEQASTQVVITSLYISFMPCFGFGIATQTLVGNSLGNNDPSEAYVFGVETAKLGTVFTLFVGALFVLVPDLVLMVITNNEQVIGVARPLLQLAGVAQVAYGSGIIIANALQAAGDTLFVMYLEIVTHWIIFLPVAYLLGVTWELGIVGAWAGLPVYILLYTAIAWMKFRSGSWKAIRV